MKQKLRKIPILYSLLENLTTRITVNVCSCLQLWFFIHSLCLNIFYYLLSVCLFFYIFFHSTLQLVLRLFEFAFCFKVVFLEELLNLAHCGFVSDFLFPTPLLLSHRFWYFMRSLGISAFMILLICVIYMRSVLINIQHDSGVSECK